MRVHAAARTLSSFGTGLTGLPQHPKFVALAKGRKSLKTESGPGPRDLRTCGGLPRVYAKISAHTAVVAASNVVRYLSTSWMCAGLSNLCEVTKQGWFQLSLDIPRLLRYCIVPLPINF